MGYVLIISFILHFISFYFLVILYQRQKNQQPFDKDKTLREMEDLLVAYTTEMKENNERLASIVTREQKNAPHISFSPKKNRQITDEESIPKNVVNKNLEKQNSVKQNYHKQNDGNTTETFSKEEFVDYSPPIPNDESPPIETSPVSQILSLYKRGIDIKEIAKELNMGAGEVE